MVVFSSENEWAEQYPWFFFSTEIFPVAIETRDGQGLSMAEWRTAAARDSSATGIDSLISQIQQIVKRRGQ